jgi:hypothetical protein
MIHYENSYCCSWTRENDPSIEEGAQDYENSYCCSWT